MSVTISDVVVGAGYDLNKYEDCLWLLSQQDEWDELIECVQENVDNYEEE